MNKSEKKQYMKQWRKDNREHLNQYNKQWFKDNPKYMKEWLKNNPGYNKPRPEYIKQWFEDNPGYIKRWRRENPEREAIINGKHKAKHRLLGFNPLNEYFEDSEAHHIDKNDVVYMLKKLHQSIWHCLKTGKGMEKINQLAMENIR